MGVSATKTLVQTGGSSTCDSSPLQHPREVEEKEKSQDWAVAAPRPCMGYHHTEKRSGSEGLSFLRQSCSLTHSLAVPRF